MTPEPGLLVPSARTAPGGTEGGQDRHSRSAGRPKPPGRPRARHEAPQPRVRGTRAHPRDPHGLSGAFLPAPAERGAGGLAAATPRPRRRPAPGPGPRREPWRGAALAPGRGCPSLGPPIAGTFPTSEALRPGPPLPSAAGRAARQPAAPPGGALLRAAGPLGPGRAVPPAGRPPARPGPSGPPVPAPPAAAAPHRPAGLRGRAGSRPGRAAAPQGGCGSAGAGQRVPPAPPRRGRPGPALPVPSPALPCPARPRAAAAGIPAPARPRLAAENASQRAAPRPPGAAQKFRGRRRAGRRGRRPAGGWGAGHGTAGLTSFWRGSCG